MSNPITKYWRGILNEGEKIVVHANFGTWWHIALEAKWRNKALLVFEVPEDISMDIARKIEEFLQEEIE